MSCPSWNDLVEARDAAADGGAWRDALQHLDGCDRCRPAALAADPTLVFRRLPAPEVSDRDVAAMRERVALLRRARELEAIASGPRRGSWGRRTARVAAAVLVVGSLSAIDFPAPEPARNVTTTPRPLPYQLVTQPVLEETGLPFESVEWTYPDLAVVMLVDDGLDV